MGAPFDAPDIGFDPGVNEAASVRIVLQLLTEAGAITDSLHGNLPQDFPFDTIPSSIQTLKNLGVA